MPENTKKAYSLLFELRNLSVLRNFGTHLYGNRAKNFLLFKSVLQSFKIVGLDFCLLWCLLIQLLN